MTESKGLLHPIRRLAWLALISGIIFGAVTWGVATNQQDASYTPELALDLQGGTEIILTPTVLDGQQVSVEQLDQAVAIIRQRIDGTGVGEASVSTQGGQNIVVAIPGTPSESTLSLIKASALLQFRPVLAIAAGTPASPTPTTTESATTGTDGETTDDTTGSDTTTEGESTEGETAAEPQNASDPAWITPEIRKAFDELDCATEFRTPGQVDDPALPLVTCDAEKSAKFILGPVEVEGANIADAFSGTRQTATGAVTNDWVINLEFDETGTTAFSAVTSRLFTLQAPQNQFAVTLDGYVITAPSTNAVITNGKAEISGSFTQESATALAEQLKFGSLPIGFEVESQSNVSATLGQESLNAGLIAGLIGLILVVVYMAFQYRALSVVVLGSLAVAALLVYLAIAYLSWRQGYRLSLAGVAGLIVAIGITADSFIVYFERIRDELREGRTLDAAVEVGWRRALRTILVSDAVSLTAAVVLYLLTSSNVRGFAYTLGLITLIDILVVTMFSHPMVQLLSRMNFFRTGGKWSGFEVKAVSATAYRGRGQFVTSSSLRSGKRESASKEAIKRQTIAERKAAAAEKESN